MPLKKKTKKTWHCNILFSTRIFTRLE